MEIIFFHDPALTQKHFGVHEAEKVRLMSRADPQGALQILMEAGTGPTTLRALLAALTDKDLESLRSAEPIRELLAFLTQAVGNPSQSSVA